MLTSLAKSVLDSISDVEQNQGPEQLTNINVDTKQEQDNDESKQEQDNDESKQEQDNDESKQEQREQIQQRTDVDVNKENDTNESNQVQDDSELIINSSQSQIERKRRFNNNIFNKAILHKEVVLDISEIGQNIDSILLSKLTAIIEGKCILEGYIKQDSCKVLTYSTGLLHGSKIIYQVAIECLICKPYEGMVIDCIVKNITQTAGIRAELNNNPSPMVIYLARDHHLGRADFTAIKINDKIKIKVIGERYELNDTYVSVIGELMRKRLTKQPILRIKD